MKFVVTFVLIAAAWVLLGALAKRGRAQRDNVEEMARRATQKAAGVEQTTQCSVCGAYRPVTDKMPCERDDCPYRQGA